MSSSYSSSDELCEKRTHGGRRKGSGRKPLPPHLKKARRKFFEERNKQIRLRRELIHDLEAWGEKHGMKRTSYSDIIALGFEIVKREEEKEKKVRDDKLKQSLNSLDIHAPPLLRFKKQKLQTSTDSIHDLDEEAVSSPSSSSSLSSSTDETVLSDEHIYDSSSKYSHKGRLARNLNNNNNNNDNNNTNYQCTTKAGSIDGLLNDEEEDDDQQLVEGLHKEVISLILKLRKEVMMTYIPNNTPSYLEE